jgi:hypothetical protein
MSATADALNAAPPKAPPRRGFLDLECILCGTSDTLTVELQEVTTFACSHCKGTFDVSEVCAHLDRWGRVVMWLAMAPELEG